MARTRPREKFGIPVATGPTLVGAGGRTLAAGFFQFEEPSSAGTAPKLCS
jgi:hypothetical protein